MKYSLICFDAGFTLIQPRRDMAQSLGARLAEAGVTPTEEALRQAWNIADRWFWEEYHRPNNGTWSSDEAIRQTWRHYHSLMLRELGLEDPDNTIVDAVIAMHYAADNWQPYPDTLPALEALQQLGVTMGVVSDWDSNLPRILDGNGLLPYFDFVLASAAAGAAKPDAAFYRMALEHGAVPPEAALMVGDSYKADVLGARSVGMHGVLLDRTGRADVTDAPIIRSLEELITIVQA